MCESSTPSSSRFFATSPLTKRGRSPDARFPVFVRDRCCPFDGGVITDAINERAVDSVSEYHSELAGVVRAQRNIGSNEGVLDLQGEVLSKGVVVAGPNNADL